MLEKQIQEQLWYSVGLKRAKVVVTKYSGYESVIIEENWCKIVGGSTDFEIHVLIYEDSDFKGIVIGYPKSAEVEGIGMDLKHVYSLTQIHDGRGV